MSVHEELDAWKRLSVERKDLQRQVLDMGKQLKELEAELLDAMMRANIQEVDLDGGKKLQIDRRLKEVKT